MSFEGLELQNHDITASKCNAIFNIRGAFLNAFI